MGGYRVIIAGSRSMTQLDTLKGIVSALLSNKIEVTEVVCGMARGPDLFGKAWAEKNGIKVSEYPADWETYGKKAGYLRNIQMAENADFLIAIWDGESRGTKHMIDIATKKGLGVYIYTPSIRSNI